jgi:ABC-type transport system involved in cytochrome bd biosynthesis fused ATPase/permease subunit
MFILLVLLALVVSFLITAGLVWLLCWLLPAIGIVAIGTFTIVFSWKLALVIWLIIALLRSIFSSVSKNWKENKKMDVQAAKEFLERRSVDDLQSIIVLAQQQIQRIKENQQAKYMGAIRKAFEDYFENVGPIEVTFGYEDADGMESAATIEVNSDNPPCFYQQSIEFP